LETNIKNLELQRAEDLKIWEEQFETLKRENKKVTDEQRGKIHDLEAQN
jgi:hypothetical protein